MGDWQRRARNNNKRLSSDVRGKTQVEGHLRLVLPYAPTISIRPPRWPHHHLRRGRYLTIQRNGICQIYSGHPSRHRQIWTTALRPMRFSSSPRSMISPRSTSSGGRVYSVSKSGGNASLVIRPECTLIWALQAVVRPGVPDVCVVYGAWPSLSVRRSWIYAPSNEAREGFQIWKTSWTFRKAFSSTC